MKSRILESIKNNKGKEESINLEAKIDPKTQSITITAEHKDKKWQRLLLK
ncbi:hypothetical protein [Thermodesulfobacterium hveragerdense]|nr:hypothetical protein [Thermodesulfobacterium hveragerdense]